MHRLGAWRRRETALYLLDLDDQTWHEIDTARAMAVLGYFWPEGAGAMDDDGLIDVAGSP